MQVLSLSLLKQYMLAQKILKTTKQQQMVVLLLQQAVAGFKQVQAHHKQQVNLFLLLLTQKSQLYQQKLLKVLVYLEPLEHMIMTMSQKI